MDHSIQKSPEQHISEHLPEEPIGQKSLSGSKVFLPRASSFPENHQPQHHHRHGVECKPVQGGEPQDACSPAGESCHGGPAVLHHCLVVGDGGLAEGLHLPCLVQLSPHSVPGHDENWIGITACACSAIYSFYNKVLLKYCG